MRSQGSDCNQGSRGIAAVVAATSKRVVRRVGLLDPLNLESDLHKEEAERGEANQIRPRHWSRRISLHPIECRIRTMSILG